MTERGCDNNSSVTPITRFQRRTDESRRLYHEATKYMPGGQTRDAIYHSPYPPYLSEGDGCRVFDVDGNEYLDFVNNMTSLIHGHAPSNVVDSTADQLHRGSALGGPTKSEIEWAKHFYKRIPCVEKIRFTNSGTEATMNAIRAARAYTGNSLIAKFEGSYHGTHDTALISVDPPAHLSGPLNNPRSVPDSAGIPECAVENVLTLPFNASEEALAILKSYQSDLAGIIFAPLMGSNIIPAEKEFIKQMREFTLERNIPLICDEIISFRIQYEGAHTHYGIEPDLITYGKLIGGGLPVGAFGGREKYMEGFGSAGGKVIVHSGTFNANSATAVAGLQTLNKYDQKAIEDLNDLGSRLAQSANEVIEEHNISIEMNQVGSLFNMYFTNKSIKNYRDTRHSNSELAKDLYLDFLNQGIRLTPNLMGCLSTPMTISEVHEFVNALDHSLNQIRPRIKEKAPELLE